MNKKAIKHMLRNKFFVVFVPLLMVVSNVHAASDGNRLDVAYTVRNLYCEIIDTISGPLGVMVGLSIALYGFYKFLMSGSIGAIGIILVGASIPLAPQFLANFSQGVAAAFPLSSSVPNGTGVSPGHTMSVLNNGCAAGGYDVPAEAMSSVSTEDQQEIQELTNAESKQAAADALKYFGTLKVRYSAVSSEVSSE